jgi:hypothetical protein
MKHFLSLLVFCCTTSAFAVQVSGTALLEDWIGHSGICVLFEAASPSAETDSAGTNIDGQYNLDLEPGIYDAIFSYQGFRPDTIHGEPITGSTLIPEIILIPLNESLAGNLSGSIGPGTYRVVDEIIIQGGESLTMAPGTRFLFTGQYSFTIEGSLHAEGTDTDSIIFSTWGDTEHWQGLVLFSSSHSTFSYCLIENVGPDNGPDPPLAAINANAFIYIWNSTISANNGLWAGGICVWSRIVDISQCVISGNTGLAGGIYVDGAGASIQGCIIAGNSSSPVDGSAIRLSDASFEMKNTIVANNEGYALRAFGGSSVSHIVYNLFYENTRGLFHSGDPLPSIIGQIITTNANGDWCDTYYNIVEDPLFVSAENGNFHLQAGSPCIDAGDPSLTNDPDGTVSDIGAFYYPQTHATRENNLPLPADIVLHQNYPNPFNATTSIEFEIPSSGLVKLELYDIQGRFTATLLNNLLSAGLHQIKFNGSELPSGVYIYRLTAQNQLQIRKMVILK